MFNRDDKQAEVLLSLQGHILSKDESPSNLEKAEQKDNPHVEEESQGSREQSRGERAATTSS